MSKLIQAQVNIDPNSLSISYDDKVAEFFVPIPWDSTLYVTDIGGVKMGYAPRYRLRQLLTQVEEMYPTGIPKETVLSERKPEVLSEKPIVRRHGYNDLGEKIKKERKKFMGFEPQPYKWDIGGGTVSEDTYNAINRPEENFERTQASRGGNKMGYFKKESQVDVTKELKPGGEQFKNAGDVEKLNYNPKPGAFDVAPNVQQETDTKIGLESKSEGPSIPASEIKPVKAFGISWKRVKAADEGKSIDPNSSQFKTPGDKEKLQYPTKADAMPSVKQPGTEKSSDPASKQFKDPGTKEKLEVPTGKADVPSIPIVVAKDEKIGGKFKDAGEKEKLIINPKQETVNVSQEKVKIDVPMAKYETVKPIQKQFSQIDWFKRAATELTPEAREFVSQKVKKNVEEGKPQEQAIAIAHSQAREKGYDVPESPKKADLETMRSNIVQYATYCPVCFQNLVLQVAAELDDFKVPELPATPNVEETKTDAAPSTTVTAALMPEESKLLVDIATKISQGTASDDEKRKLGELTTKVAASLVKKADAVVEETDVLADAERAMEEQLAKELLNPVAPAAPVAPTVTQ